MNASSRLARPAARHDRAAGFTLIEVLIALMIFGVGVLSLGLVIPMATKRVTSAGVQTRASSLAAERAETLLTLPYGDSQLTSGLHADPANPIEGSYYVQWTVTDNQPQPNCKRVRVVVSRTSVFGRPEAAVTIVCPQSGT